MMTNTMTAAIEKNRSDFSNTFGTDTGPKCRKCSQTLWLYELTPVDCRFNIVALCTFCHRVEEWRDDVSEDIKEIKASHFAAVGNCDTTLVFAGLCS
jgi:hypothetical protein